MNELLWFVSRAAGLVSVVLLSATVVLGLLTAGRAAPIAAPSSVRAALHRSISLVMVVGVAVHVVTAIAETYVDIGWLSLLIPFTSGYAPVWVGLGTIALDLLLIIVATSLLRDRIPTRTWRLVHWFAYAMWPIAVLHGVTTSTSDTTAVWVTSAVCAVGVVVAAVWRAGRQTVDARRRTTVDAIGWR
ncbi:MAG TPA: ferric reductase-like transmembrane domain-containing protein [Propionibacteriaceae bacterium]